MEYARGQARWPLREYVVPIVVALGLVACLPLLGFLAFTLRSVLLIVGPIVILAIALSCVRWRRIGEGLIARVGPETSYRGLHLARDVAFHAGHCWASIDGDVVVGSDDLVQAALGPIDEVTLPEEGRHVCRGEPLFRLRHDDRSIALPSPVTGTVLGINSELRDHPELVNQKPFGAGWVVRLHGEDVAEDRRHLMLGRKAWDWFRREVDLVLRILPPERSDAEALHRRIDDGAWSVLKSALGSA